MLKGIINQYNKNKNSLLNKTQLDLLSRELFVTKEQELVDLKEKAKHLPQININKVCDLKK